MGEFVAGRTDDPNKLCEGNTDNPQRVVHSYHPKTTTKNSRLPPYAVTISEYPLLPKDPKPNSSHDIEQKDIDLTNYPLCNSQWIDNFSHLIQNYSASCSNELLNNRLHFAEDLTAYLVNYHTVTSAPFIANLIKIEPKFNNNSNSQSNQCYATSYEMKPNQFTPNDTPREDQRATNSPISVAGAVVTESTKIESSKKTNKAGNSNVSKSRSCSVCGKSFKYPSDLKKHIQIHDDSKRYTCEVCDKSFRREHQLTVHKRIHTGEKPFSCQYCGANFRHDSTYSLHIRAKHDNIKPFFCDKCNKTFGRISHLKKHQNSACKGIQRSLDSTKQLQGGDGRSPDFATDDKQLQSTAISNDFNSESLTSRIAQTPNTDNLADSTQKSIIIRCQYCFQDFEKTTDLRRHLNGPGNCNVLYLIDLERKENKFNSVEYSNDSMTPLISVEHRISQIPHPKVIFAITANCNNISQPKNATNPISLNIQPNMEPISGDNSARKTSPNTTNNNDPNTHIPYDPMLNMPSCFANSFGNLVSTPNCLFDNIMPNSTFFDDQVFDLFKDFDFQTNHVNNPTDFDSKHPPPPPDQ